MKQVSFLFAALIIASALCAAPARNLAAGDTHPLIKRALAALHAAKTDLQNAAHDYCGHRAEALEASNSAIDQLQQALNCANRKGTASDAASEMGSESASPAGERHPNIDKAISALGAAEGDLQNATHDYCGHRVTALDAVRGALDQLKLTVQCDRK